jgi:class 3 adenylate cyclase
MASERKQLEALIRGLEAQRQLLGDAYVDTGLAPLRARLAALPGAETAGIAEQAEQALRLVTILFLDIVGSTALSRRLHPEEAHALFDGALARCTTVVDAHAGKVLQYAGDGLLAVFGADRAREDDAERAVRCGLALLDEGRRIAADVAQRHGDKGFDVRVGIHTGDVLLGGGVDGAGTIRGAPVAVAARMEQTAPPGHLRISQDTHRHVSGAFDVEPQAPIAVKGVEEPVATFLVRRARPRAFRVVSRGIEGVETRLVAREAELATLQEALDAVIRTRLLRVVSVVAEAGLGKSRLVRELEGWGRARHPGLVVLRGRAYPMSRSQPYGLLRDVLARRLQIGDGDSVEAARQKIEAGIAPLFIADAGADMAEAHAHLVGHLIGLDFSASPHVRGIRDDARQIRHRAFHAAAEVLRRSASRTAAALVLLVDDLHWADDGSLDFLEHLAATDRDLPLLLVAMSRPVLFERRPGWGSGGKRIDLGPLDGDAGVHLATDLLSRLDPVPDTVVGFVAGRAAGNPFYMEELVKMLVDQGAIETGAERWVLHPEKLAAEGVPASLTGVLQARLDGLPAPERLALQEASVIGEVFWDRALEGLDETAPAALPALVRRELTLPRPDSALDDVREYAFSHQLLHTVTYETLLKRTRRALHARAAAWLGHLTGARAADFLGAAARHHELAGETLPACALYADAAEHAKARHAHDVASSHVERALALLGCEDVSESGSAGRGWPADAAARALCWRLLLVREYVVNTQGRREEQRDVLATMERLADALDDDARRAHVVRRRALMALRVADYPAQEEAARLAIAFAERAGDAESRLDGQRLLADARASRGDFEGGRALARAGLAEARALGFRRLEGTFLNALSYIAGLQDDQVEGLALDQQDLAIWRELGDKQGEVIALGNVGADWLWFGELERARALLEESLAIARAIGARQLEGVPLTNLSLLALCAGDADAARTFACAARDVAAQVQGPDVEGMAWYRLGEAELARGDLLAAGEAFERAGTIARAIDHGVEHDATGGLARVALERGEVDRAMAIAESLLAHVAGGGTFEGADPRLVRYTAQRVLARAGDARASEMLAQVHAELDARASTIGDLALRRSFLENVPHHRAIVAAWRAAGGKAA